VAKRRVKMLTSMVAADWSLSPGQITEVDEEVAHAWSEAGIADLVANEMEMATVKTPETAAKRRKKGD
jgi:hypothetical protein